MSNETIKRSENNRSLIFLLVVIVVASAAIVNFLLQQSPANVSLAQDIPDEPAKSVSKYPGADWTLTNLQGEQVTLSAFQGRPVLLVFWATWCPYCKKLLPGIAELNEQYEAKGLKVIAVNIKEDWKPEVYWRNHEYQFDAVLAGDDVANIYGISGTPGLVFIDPQGKVLGVKSFSDPKHPLLDAFAKHYTDSESSQEKENWPTKEAFN